MCKKLLFIALLLFSKTLTFSQLSLTGIIIDEKNEPLPFVNILINKNQTDGVSSDIDGNFTINSKESIQTLTLSFVGFEQLVYSVQQKDFGKKLVLSMKSTSFDLQEAVVIAGENPAHRIIRKVVKNRDQNNPEKMESFQCLTYNKMIVELIPNATKIQEFQKEHQDSEKKIRKKQSQNFEKMLGNTKRSHLFIMESVSERSFLFPEKNKEHVLHNQVSGFQDPSFVALANDFQPFSFYGDHIEILDKAFLNPISPNSTKKYFFNIVDTLLQKTDSVFIISYHPKKGKNFEGLKGLLYINTNGYALQNVIAEPNDKSLIKMKIEQRYLQVEGKQWFPEQLNFVIEASKYPHKYVGTRLSGKSYISDVQLNPKLNKKDFKIQGYTTSKDANERVDSIWQKHRPQVLHPKEEKTYVVMDSIGKKNKFDQILKANEALVSGRFPIKKFDILLPNILSFNDFEGTRLGLGLSTNDQLSNHFELSGYGGFGLKDKKWKYGGALLLNFLPDKKLQLKFNYQQDLREPAALALSTEPQLFSRQLYASRMDSWENKSIHLKGKLKHTVQFNLSFGQSTWQPQYEYQFEGSDLNFEKFTFTEIGVNLRFAFAEKIVRVMGTEISTSRFPLIYLSYKKGLKDIWQGEFDFQKIAFSVEDNFRIRGFGETSIRVEAGIVDGKLPYNRLYAASGIGRGFQFLEIESTFQTMDIYEFLSDRFVHLFFEHNFKTLLFKYKNFKPEFSIVQNIGFGSLKNPELHQGLEFKTMEKGFFESGFRVDNLLRFNYFNLMYVGVGGGIYYRYGDYAFSALEDNLAYRLRLKFSF
ncbi:MAG: DUF5686 family protein [Saprospiraceae bacterium]